MPTTAPPDPKALEEPILDKKQLRDRLVLPSVRAVEDLVRDRKIPAVRLGRKRTVFSWPRVCEALARLEIRAISN